MEKALRRAIDLIGGPAAVARLFDINTQAVSQWEKCPANRVHAISDACGGQVTAHELRPDIFPASTRSAA